MAVFNTIKKGQTVTKSDIDNLMVGDIVPNCFGELKPIVKIHHKGLDINGKIFACFYQQFGESPTTTISNSAKEGEIIYTIN